MSKTIYVPEDANEDDLHRIVNSIVEMTGAGERSGRVDWGDFGAGELNEELWDDYEKMIQNDPGFWEEYRERKGCDSE